MVGDHFTKYMSAYALPNQETKTVARILEEEHFCQNGFPEQLHSDQGPQFESEVIAEMCKTMGIRKTRTTPYHPACNGEIERFNKTLVTVWLQLWMGATSPGIGMSSWLALHIIPVCMLPQAIHPSTLCMGMIPDSQLTSCVVHFSRMTSHIVNMWPTYKDVGAGIRKST